MALRRYLRLLIGCTHSIRPLSHHLLAAKETILVAPKRQLQCSRLPLFHVFTYPTRLGPCRHYVIGTSNDNGNTNNKDDSNNTWSDASLISADPSNPSTDSIDSSESVYHDKEKSAFGNTNVINNNSVMAIHETSIEGVVEWSDQEDNAVATDQTKNASRDSWSSDDDLVIFPDHDSLRMRQQKTQTKDDRRRDVVTEDYKQDEQDLQALLRNIQHQQEQSKRTQREKRSIMMNVEELVEFLREENARDVCVIEVPPEVDYVNYFIVCSGLGSRHIGRMADHLASEVHTMCTYVCACDKAPCLHYFYAVN